MEKVNFALVGCGRISKKHIEAIQEIPQANLVSVCDTNIKRAKKVGESLNIPYYSSYDEMLNNENVDIVNILTPSGLHAKHTIDIVKKYKKHIICEKPMALRIEDADEMIKTCNENNVKLFIVKQNRFNLPVLKLREAVEQKRFGKLVLGTVRVRWCRTQQYYDQDAWRGTWQMDGGVITNQASHHIDLLEWMMGEPASVMTMNGTFLSKIDTDDTSVSIIRFKSGSLGVVEATTATRPSDLEGSISILGERGNVIIGGFAVNKMQEWNFIDSDESEKNNILTKYAENPPNVYGFGHKRYIEHVIDCLINNKKPIVDGVEGRKSVELINAMYESAETKQMITLPFKPKFSKLGK